MEHELTPYIFAVGMILLMLIVCVLLASFSCSLYFTEDMRLSSLEDKEKEHQDKIQDAIEMKVSPQKIKI